MPLRTERSPSNSTSAPAPVRSIALALTINALAVTSLLAQAPSTPSAPTPVAPPVPSALATAQTGSQTGSQTGAVALRGTVSDPDDELIPGAIVTLVPSSGKPFTATSGSDGTYTLRNAPAGTYTLTITMAGFGAFVRQGVRVSATNPLTINAKLTVQDSTQVVNVTATGATVSVDQDSNASSTVLTGKDLDALSDDPDELSSELSALAGPSSGPNGGQIYIDGFTGGQLPPKSSIREIRINQNPFSAQYDRPGFGRVEIFTKPGTDKLHGNAQLQGSDKSFNTGSPFVPAGTFQPDYHTILFNGSVTGPINKRSSFATGGSLRKTQDNNVVNPPAIYSDQSELRNHLLPRNRRVRHLFQPQRQRLHPRPVRSADPLGHLPAHRPPTQREEHPHHALPIPAQQQPERRHHRRRPVLHRRKRQQLRDHPPGQRHPHLLAQSHQRDSLRVPALQLQRHSLQHRAYYQRAGRLHWRGQQLRCVGRHRKPHRIPELHLHRPQKELHPSWRPPSYYQREQHHERWREWHLHLQQHLRLHRSDHQLLHPICRRRQASTVSQYSITNIPVPTISARSHRRGPIRRNRLEGKTQLDHQLRYSLRDSELHPRSG